MGETERDEACARSLSLKRKINERPGEVVCICEKNGNVSLLDPGAWIRTMTIHYRKANEEGEKGNDNA